MFKDRLCISAFEQARMLILGKYVLQGVINTIYKDSHAWVLSEHVLYFSFDTGCCVKMKQEYSSVIHKH